MAQPRVIPFMQLLCDQGYVVSLETNGYYDTAYVDPKVKKNVDNKTTQSGEGDSFNFKNLQALLPHDEVKFVICSDADYDWAKNLIFRKETK